MSHYQFAKKQLFYIAVILFLALPSALYAQTANKSEISGKVKAEDGSSLEKVSVSLISPQQVVVATVETDSSGTFTFFDTPIGNYVLQFSKKEFASQRLPVRVSGDEKSEVNVALGVDSIEDTISVTAETGQAQEKNQIPQQVNIISNELIQQRATAVLAQVADEEEGVSLQRTSPSLGSIFVRGLTGRYVSVYVDGIRYTTGSQRGGINTFFNLNEPSNLQTLEVLRGPNSAQYGSGALGGTLQLVSRVPSYNGKDELHGELRTNFTSADLSYGSSTLLSYGAQRWGALLNLAGRRVNTLRPSQGIDSRAAVTRFLGLRSDIFGNRLTDTAFTQYSGTVALTFNPAVGNQFVVYYQRSQQDGGKRYDQTLGGDGNLIANLKNLMLDFGYLRYNRQQLGFFDNGTFTFSFNSQREERVNQGGQGNPLGGITSQFERTNVVGFSFNVDKQLAKRNTLLLGADVYRERVESPAFTFNPVARTATPSRPRIPDNARYITYGFYVQDVYQVIPSRLRFSSALRFGVASYKARAIDSALVRGQRLVPDDSARVDDFSGRIGLVYTFTPGLDIAFNYSRGFNAPNTTELGTLGLTGDGFEVATVEARQLGGSFGNMAGDKAISTDQPIKAISSEFSNNFDLSFRFHNQRLSASVTGFITDINDPIVKQSLILPQGAVGKFLGDQPIVRQLANGVVFVPLSASPVLVRGNFGDARTFGVETALDLKLTSSFSFSGNFTYLRAKDKATGLPPNIEGGTPASSGFLKLRYAPTSKYYWIEVYGNLVASQDRLSSLDLADRRTGATRSQANIASFFNNGARVRGLIGNGLDGRPGTMDDILLPTGETLAQVQNRVLGNAMSAPLFPVLAGYGLINLRGGFRVSENSEINIDFENIADKSYRGISSGVDGPGRSVSVRYRLRF
jgi:outer membrane receptor protein involved in Fe transport